MSGLFVPLDVDYASDDEFIEAGPLAELLYIRGLCFIKRKMTDGHIAQNQLKVVASGIPNARKCAENLENVGLWLRNGDGWVVPAYLKRNSSRAEIQAGKQIASEAGTRGNHERWHVGPDGNPSPKCRLCRLEIIGLPDSGANRGESPLTETETETESLPEPYIDPQDRYDGEMAVIHNLRIGETAW